MRNVKSCGILAVRKRDEGHDLLVMKHRHRYDLPKGHLEEGETDLECALREWTEETGVAADDLELVSNCTYEISYQTKYKRYVGALVSKTVRLFVAHVGAELEIHPTEHADFEWLPIDPARSYESKTIDAVVQFLALQDLEEECSA